MNTLIIILVICGVALFWYSKSKTNIYEPNNGNGGEDLLPGTGNDVDMYDYPDRDGDIKE